MTILGKPCPRPWDKLEKLRLKNSGFHTEIAGTWVLMKVFAIKDKNTLLSITMAGIKEN